MRRLGDLVAEIMDRFWTWSRPATVREVVDDINKPRPVAYTTVMTVTNIPYGKGWLLRGKQGYDAGRKVSKADLQPGDIIYWYNDSQHNGLYIGDGKAIHAPRTGKNIEIAQLDSMPFSAASRP